MHPEMSLVFLTVLAGIGQGIFILYFVLEMVLVGTLSPVFAYTSILSCIVLQYLGSAASLLHLGNPQRAWKAVRMWKHSWLSREILTMGGFMGIVHLYLLSMYFGIGFTEHVILGSIAILFSIGFYVSSSMLYATIRFIKEWANGFTPLNFALSGLLVGSSIGFTLLHLIQSDLPGLKAVNVLVILLTCMAMIIKMLTFRFNSKVYVPITLKNALGVNDPNIRLMDMGAAYDHYNTIDFHFPLTQRQLQTQKAIIILFIFILPLIGWLLMLYTNLGNIINIVIGFSNVGLMMLGYLIERRLFFIEGNHLQNLYYGNFRSNKVANPLLTKARKGTPIP